MKLGVLLFEGFERTDVSVPVNIFEGIKGKYQITYYSESGGIIKDKDGIGIETEPVSGINNADVLLIPGGMGVKAAAGTSSLIQLLKTAAQSGKYILTVGAGSALPGKAGLLEQRAAATDWTEFDWIGEISLHIRWMRRGRWIVDDKYYTAVDSDAAKEMISAFLIDLGQKHT